MHRSANILRRAVHTDAGVSSNSRIARAATKSAHGTQMAPVNGMTRLSPAWFSVRSCSHSPPEMHLVQLASSNGTSVALMQLVLSRLTNEWNPGRIAIMYRARSRAPAPCSFGLTDPTNDGGTTRCSWPAGTGSEMHQCVASGVAGRLMSSSTRWLNKMFFSVSNSTPHMSGRFFKIKSKTRHSAISSVDTNLFCRIQDFNTTRWFL